MARKATKRASKRSKKDNFWKIGTKSPSKSAKDFLKTVKSGKGNLGKGFFKI